MCRRTFKNRVDVQLSDALRVDIINALTTGEEGFYEVNYDARLLVA
jgi:hypothetical protein